MLRSRHAVVRIGWPLGAAAALGCAALSLTAYVGSSAAPHAAAAGVAVDGSVASHQTTAGATITAGPLSTSNAGDVLVAFLASDGPNAPGGQAFSSVAGGGLAWTLRHRTNGQPGTAEIWQAVAPEYSTASPSRRRAAPVPTSAAS